LEAAAAAGYPNPLQATESFAATYGLSPVGDDRTWTKVYVKFQGDGFPKVVVINGISGSSVSPQWEVRYADDGYESGNPQATINVVRARIDTVLTSVPPRLTLTAPASFSTVTTPKVTVTGTAWSAVGITNVDFQVVNRFETRDYAGATTANSWTNLSLMASNLTAGTNTLRVRAWDAFGRSRVATRTVFFQSKKALKLARSGPGTFSPNYSNASLAVGSNYTLTANEPAGYLLESWMSGIGAVTGVVSRARSLGFTMETGLCLQANFIVNPFLVATGGYYGLFYPDSGVQHTNSGYFQFNLGSRGGFTAKLLCGGFTNALSGTLALDGKGTNEVGSNGVVRVEWSLDLSPQYHQQITGRVVLAESEAGLLGDRPPFFGTNRTSSFRGTYTATIPGVARETNAPTGDAALSLTVATNGWLTLAGRLADDVQVVQSAPISTNGYWPLYVPLYKGQGSVLGWVQMNRKAAPQTNVASSRVLWTKPAILNAAYYPEGFVVERTLRGYIYTATKPVLPISTNGFIEFEGGGLENPVVNSVALRTTNTVVNLTPAVPLTATITNADGMFTGNVTFPGGGAVTYRGIILQRETNGVGYFRRSGQSGHVLFGKMP
jgi:hypothetical protein